jgi:predicted nucleic acid-binding protein
MPGSFADTNILVYLASGDAQKAARAESVLAAGCTISVQVLNEFTHVARRKMAFTWDEVRDFLGTVRAIAKVVPLTIETHDEGVQIADRYRLSVYDGMIVAAALGARCHTLWSEDMQDGLVIEERLTIRNPFTTEAEREGRT